MTEAIAAASWRSVVKKATTIGSCLIGSRSTNRFKWRDCDAGTEHRHVLRRVAVQMRYQILRMTPFYLNKIRITNKLKHLDA